MKKILRVMLVVLMLIVAMGISTSCSNNSEKSTSSSTNSEKNDKSDIDKKEKENINEEDYNTGITYDQLARQPDKYEGEKATFSGEVLQVMEEDETTVIRLAVDKNYDTVMMLGIPKNLKLESRILEKDYITVRGTSKGIITYESSLSGNITVPALLVEGVGELESVDEDYSKENSEEEVKNETSKSSSSEKSVYTKKLATVNKEVNDMSVAGSTAQMEDALAEQYSKWDDLLNDIYGVLKTQLSSEDMEALKKEQRSWIKTRDKKAKEASDSAGDGSAFNIEYTKSLIETTKDRCHELVEDYMK